MARSTHGLWLIAVLLLAGCGGESAETIGQVRERYQTPVFNIRTYLKGLHQRLPASALGVSGKLDPQPIYAPGQEIGNTEILPVERLLDPDAKPLVDLSLPSDLRQALAWTGTASVDDPSSRKAATPDYEQTFKRALAARYLVVLRSMKGSDAEAAIEAFVVDMKSSKIVASVVAGGAGVREDLANKLNGATGGSFRFPELRTRR
jgi:hypothetical protein